jgi:hypothetical protein
MRSTSFAPQET